MKVKITIKSETSSAKIIKRYLAEKAAFREAVAKGDVSSFVKQRGIKFDSPISSKH